MRIVSSTSESQAQTIIVLSQSELLKALKTFAVGQALSLQWAD